MAKQQDPDIAIKFDNLSRETRSIEEFKLTSDWVGQMDSWSATIYEADPALMDRLDLEPVTILIDGQEVLHGRVERTTFGGRGTGVRLSGRDQRGDLDRCQVDPSYKIKKGATLGDVILEVTSVCGINVVHVDGVDLRRDLLTGAPPGGAQPVGFKTAKVQEYKPGDNETIMSFIKRLVARFGATVQAGSKRDTLILCAPDYLVSPMGPITNLVGNSSNNIVKTSSCARDYTNIPSYVVVAGKQWEKATKKSKPISSESQVSLRPFVTKQGRLKPGDTIQDGEMYALMYRRSKDARTQAELDHILNRAIAERFNKSLHYNVTLRGYLDPTTGLMWAPNTTVNVRDEVCRLSEALWVPKREFTYGGSGTTTQLTCWLPDTYKL